MKHSFFAVALSVLVLSGALVGCQKDEPVGNKVPTDNEFALVKYSVGKSYRYFKESAESWGLVPKPNKEGRFLKQENGYNKEFSVWTIGYDYNDTNVIYEGSLYVNVQNFDTMKSVFKRWLAEFRVVTNLKNMVRVGFSSSADNVNKSYDDFDSFMADVDRLQFQNELSMYAQLVENNGFEYHFTFCWRQYVKGLEVQVSNRLALRKEPELPMVDSIVGKSDDILVMKVDYMTFKFMGYSTMNMPCQMRTPSHSVRNTRIRAISGISNSITDGKIPATCFSTVQLYGQAAARWNILKILLHVVAT